MVSTVEFESIVILLETIEKLFKKSVLNENFISECVNHFKKMITDFEEGRVAKNAIHLKKPNPAEKILIKKLNEINRFLSKTDLFLVEYEKLVLILIRLIDIIEEIKKENFQKSSFSLRKSTKEDLNYELTFLAKDHKEFFNSIQNEFE